MKKTWKLFHVSYDGYPLRGRGIVIAKSKEFAVEMVKRHTGKRGIAVEEIFDLGELKDLNRKAFFKELDDGDY